MSGADDATPPFPHTEPEAAPETGPAAGAETPAAAGAETPAAGAETPAAGAETPAAGAETPAAGAETPAAAGADGSEPDAPKRTQNPHTHARRLQQEWFAMTPEQRSESIAVPKHLCRHVT